MPEALAQQAIIPGIKVDKGAVALAKFAGEKITQGLDGLRERLKEYRELGARFTKWRGDCDRREYSNSNLPRSECEDARHVRCAQPGSGAGADRRA